MARVKTFTNGGSLLPGDLNSIEDDYEFAFSSYKQTLLEGNQTMPAGGGVAATPYFLLPGGLSLLKPIGATVSSVDGGVPISIDPADWTANTRATKLRLRAACAVGATAPAVTITAGLYPITISAGSYVAGTVVAGSTVAFASPAINTLTAGLSGDFAAPAAGFYLLGFTLSGATAASSVTALRAQLQMRQV